MPAIRNRFPVVVFDDAYTWTKRNVGDDSISHLHCPPWHQCFGFHRSCSPLFLTYFWHVNPRIKKKQAKNCYIIKVSSALRALKNAHTERKDQGKEREVACCQNARKGGGKAPTPPWLRRNAVIRPRRSLSGVKVVHLCPLCPSTCPYQCWPLGGRKPSERREGMPCRGC